MNRTRDALRDMAREDPELAARLVLQTLPAAVAKIPPPIAYDLTVDGLGSWRITVDDSGAKVAPRNGDSAGNLDFRLMTDAEGLAQLAAGASPMRLMLGGKLRIRGKRRRAMKLRAMADGDDPTIADAIRAGAELDTDAVLRALPYMVDPAWTAGHSFSVAYEIGDTGRWVVHVNDGQRLSVATEGEADTTVRIAADTYRELVTGELTPAESMRSQRT